ncbi:MAG: DNA translocase FtsK 4TM domain-containing protein [Ferrovibrio sp.]|uniref:DNA translocase FtsK n=1 Tax=Ferrovibrio sp. TaxID=1917215 RepID=UPI002615AF15|nr:DNA translocase FtsK [Ferrovibrio sp.]MCW0236217.1 DNA translocase FtsK 4TM domain-containing protein [Ferrovibrio sp.]
MAARSKKKRSFFPEGFDDFLSMRAREGGGILILGLGFLLALALASFDPADPNFNHATPLAPRNWLGLPGAYISDVLLQTLGLSAWLFVLLLASWGFRIVSHRGLPRWWLNVALVPLTLILFAAFAAALPVPTVWALRAGLGGVVGDFILYHQLVPFGVMFGLPISAVLPAVLCFGFAVLCFYFASGLSMGEWRSMGAGLGFGAAATAGLAAQGIYHSGKAAMRAGQETQGFFGRLKAAFSRDDEDDKPVIRKAEPSFGKARKAAVEDDYVDPDDLDEAEDDENDLPRLPTAKRADEGRVTRRIEKPRTGVRAAREAQTTLNLGDAGDFELPELSLLKPPPADTAREKINEDALEQNARMLESVLNEFGVQGEITKVRPGPVVTLYELEPAPGTKSSRVIGLSDDIARSMSALSARVAVIPGRNAIGIELPNARRETVYLRELLGSAEFESPSTKLGLALGKDIGGSAIIADLTKMPHLLVAGTTGSGKSVAINTMILSLLYKLTPDQCRFIMVDPKMLELSVYDGIPHLLAPVVTEPGKAVVALKWTVREMEDRYRKMSELGVRNIASYNERLAQARAKEEKLGRTVQTGFDEAGKPIYEERPIDLNPLPFIVVIVDELADLMLVAGKDIEAAIQRLAQMARAAGIHLIMATQRPSVDVITGTIKANFPTRISFQVTSKIDSRTILGEQGAEQLLGMGDMLFMPGAGRISRVHGPFVSDEEVERVVKTLKDQAEPIYVEAVTADADGGKYGAPGGGGEGGSEEDTLYDQAVALVCRERKASTSFIQRHLQIGYNRAARIMERMEKEGVVGGANHVGKREVLARNIEAAE